MKTFRLAKSITLLSLFFVLVAAGNIAQADDKWRIPRPGHNKTEITPDASDGLPSAPSNVQTTAVVPDTLPLNNLPVDTHPLNVMPTLNSSPETPYSLPAPPHVHALDASIDVENNPTRASIRAIMDWQNKNLPNLQGLNGATTDSDTPLKHKGLKAHVGGAIFSTIGTVASAYVPMGTVGLRNAPIKEPTISINPGHCPAAFDPAFQIPKTWWSDLSSEEGSRDLGPGWKAWLQAVQYVFQAHAAELRETPGVAALHVIINPDGSIYNATPYTGAERANSGYPTNSRTLGHLRQIILSVGKFPPFPLGSRVPCYHLVVDGAAPN